MKRARLRRLGLDLMGEVVWPILIVVGALTYGLLALVLALAGWGRK